MSATSVPQPTTVVYGDTEGEKGGYIAGVVILSVAVVALAVVAIIFAIRNSKMRPVTGHHGENRDADFDGVAGEGDAFDSMEEESEDGEEGDEEDDDEDEDEDDG